MIRLQLLGAIDLRDENGREVRAVLAQPKRLALLAYLGAASPRGSHRRDTLLGLFWPELDQDHARNALNQAVRFLRRSIGEAALVSRSADELALDDEAVWTDVGAFCTALNRDRMDEALELYRGDFLPSFFIPEASGFEEWLEQERAHLRAQAAVAAWLLAERHEAGGHLTQAISCARQAVVLSNGDERPLRRLIELLDRLGDRAGAIHAYDTFARTLAAELQAEPAAETVALIERVRTSRHPPSTPILEQLASALSDRYQVERELGGGGMARVLLATEPALGRRVALKVLAPELARSVSADRFRREMQVAARLQHPHIVPLLTAGQAGDLLYYAMPFVEGESLRARINREGALPLPEAVRLLGEIARALSYAHEHEIVHRDLKPGNVLLAGGQAQVTDFGIAKALSNSTEAGDLIARGIGLGTPLYMAPEQAADGDAVDQRADLYSLGVLAYEMLSGVPPFTGRTSHALIMAHAEEAPVPVAIRRPAVRPQLADLIMSLLEKRPIDRPQSADAVLQMLETALSPTTGTVTVGRRVSRRRWALPIVASAIAGLGILAASAALRFLRLAPTPTLDADLVAVAPFEVLSPTLALWREGIVDVLSRDLDGAGPLRTVSPAVAIRRWRGRAEAAAAQALGRQTGAGLVVFGQVISSGADSVWLRATLVDAGVGRRLGEVELRDAAIHMDRVLESLTLKLLQEIGRERPVGAARQGSISARPLPALKAFLRGEQFYRRSMWDSALAHWDHATALDSGFAMAYYRMAHVVGWGSIQSKHYRTIKEYARRAAQLNQGQTIRDSLLLIEGGFGDLLDPDDPAFFARYRQHIAALEQASRLYPGDPEVWYVLGEARYHVHFTENVSLAEPLDAFDRAIELDSAFGPAYGHAVQLAIALGDPNRARRYATARLASAATDLSVPSLRLDALLLDPTRAGSAEAARLVDTVTGMHLWLAWWDLAQWPDSGETATRLARALLRPGRSFVGATPYIADSINRRNDLARTLAFRGHLREAYSTARADASWPAVWKAAFPDLALLGPVPADPFNALFRRTLEGGSLLSVDRELRQALPWLSAVRDTASLDLFARRADSAASRQQNPIARARLGALADAAQAYLDLVKGDSAHALRALAALPDSLCVLFDCFFEKLTQARLAAALGQDRSAAELFDRWIVGRHLNPLGVVATLDRGRVAERLGELDQAIRSYRFVADVWRNADPELQPYVLKAREGLQRLAGKNGF